MSPDGFAAALEALVPCSRLILIADQLERLYYECAEQVRLHFIDCLLACSRKGAKVIIAVRSDFYHLVLAHADLAREIKVSNLTLLNMGHDDLREIIRRPAERHHRSVQPELVERLIADVAQEPSNLPLLEFTLEHLWGRDGTSGMLRMDTYNELGMKTYDGKVITGIQYAVIARAEAFWNALDAANEQPLAKRILLALVTAPIDVSASSSSSAGYCKPLPLASRRAYQSEFDDDTSVVARKLTNSFLLTTGLDPVTNAATVQISHEILLSRWSRLSELVDEYRGFITWYARDFAPEFDSWSSKSKPDDLLLRTSLIPDAVEWLERTPFLNGPCADYIRQSNQKMLDAEKRRRQDEMAKKWLRRGLLAAVGTILLTIAYSLYDRWQGSLESTLSNAEYHLANRDLAGAVSMGM
jgi:hypothetical protein